MTRKALTILPLLCLLAALGGCGLYSWQKPGANDADFRADRDACTAGGDQNFRPCMAQKGWTFKQ